MHYEIYTDGAYNVELNKGGCSYLILCGNTYVHSDSVPLDSVDSATQAETVSIGLAAAYLIDNKDISKEDTVCFRVDCTSAITFSKLHLSKRNLRRTYCKPVIGSMEVLRMLADLCSVDFQKVRAHKNKITPNTFVDRLAKVAIRRS
ncbi:MAG: hypothetical protein IKL53_02295 [Lachnospiraceae bacterium]|nr:hypothetical protein [Lachnospiraceae bacterium]